MSLTMELLYHYFVGPPQPDRWPEELQSNPAAGHGMYAFEQGFRLGLLLAVESLGPDLLGP
ncbi:MAG TPA: hypothetical protein H9764_02885 [Candidatus Flavonifractor merdavium]|nr:hypothetical protein [Candidatus Flavonifractor merdavium]